MEEKMISGLEQAQLWGIQFGATAFAFIVMVLMMSVATGGVAWAVFRIKYWLEREIVKMRKELKPKSSLSLSDAEIERMKR